jgi:hypothetical protein
MKNPALACGASFGLWALDYLASLGGRTGGGFYNPSEALRTVVRLVCLGSLRSSKLDARANKKPRTCVRGFLWVVGNTGLEPVTSRV